MVKPGLVVLAIGLALAGCSGPQEGGEAGPAGGATASPTPPAATTGQPPAASSPAVSNPAESNTVPPGSPPPAGPPAGEGRCTAAVLTGTVQGSDAAAGNRYARLIVTNTGSAPCTLYGYGGFQLVAANGTALPTSTRRDEAPGPSLVRLMPGATAAKNLHWGVVATGDEPVDRPCQPEPRTAKVIPPDETEQFTVDWPFGPVCAAGTFHDSAYYQP